MLIRGRNNNALHKKFQLHGCIHMLTRAIALDAYLWNWR